MSVFFNLANRAFSSAFPVSPICTMGPYRPILAITFFQNGVNARSLSTNPLCIFDCIFNILFKRQVKIINHIVPFHFPAATSSNSSMRAVNGNPHIIKILLEEVSDHKAQVCRKKGISPPRVFRFGEGVYGSFFNNRTRKARLPSLSLSPHSLF